MSLTLLPAVDVANSQVVRLVQDAAGAETSYDAPLEAAMNQRNAGAERIHLVDLDAALGRGSNYDLLADVVGKLDVKVGLSDGIRGNTSFEAALTTDCARVNVGTTALENPKWCREVIANYGDRAATGLDVLNDEGQWRLRDRGWVSGGGDLWEVLECLDAQGVSHFVMTNVSEGDTLQGPNVELLREIAAATDAPIVISGGVSSLNGIAVIATLVDRGVNSTIVDKTLYVGRFTLEEALAIARG